jgi:Zn-dependent peptidase ImmA (M78 family)
MNDLLLEKSARSFRTSNSLNGTDPIRLKSLLQKINVITVFQPLSASFSGMALKAERNQNSVERFMLVNSNMTLGKQHFTICHELFHLYIQQDFKSQVCRTGLFDKKLDINEYYADIFASYLLLPTEGLLKEIPDEELNKKRISLRTILQLENYYSCSRTALLYRLKASRLIDSQAYETFSKNVKRGALENGFSTALYEPGNHSVVIGNYGSLAKELYDNEEISQSHYYSLLSDLGINIAQLDEPDNEVL